MSDTMMITDGGRSRNTARGDEGLLAREVYWMDDQGESQARGPSSANPLPLAVSATEADWTREYCSWARWQPSRRLLRSIRRYQWWRSRWGIIGRMVAKLFVLPYRFWSVVSAAEIPLDGQLAGGLLLPHPNGIVIHPKASIGPNCLIFQQVTIGTGGVISGIPQLGGHVDVGAGAKILGGVIIGDHAKVGANAVVLADVPAYCTAVGIPARILPPRPGREGPQGDGLPTNQHRDQGH